MFVHPVKTVCPYPSKIKKDLLKQISAVDQFPSQDFCIGDNGFVRSPLAIALRTEDEKLRQAILGSLPEREIVDNGDKSDSDLLKELVPRNIQTPAELRKFVDLWNQMNPVEPPMSVESIDGSEPSPEPENADS